MQVAYLRLPWATQYKGGIMGKYYAGIDLGKKDNPVVLMKNGSTIKVFKTDEKITDSISIDEKGKVSKDVNISLPVMSMKINTT